MKLPNFLKLYPYKNEYVTVLAVMFVFIVLCYWQDNPIIKKILYVLISYPIFVIIKLTIFLIITKIFNKND